MGAGEWGAGRKGGVYIKRRSSSATRNCFSHVLFIRLALFSPLPAFRFRHGFFIRFFRVFPFHIESDRCIHTSQVTEENKPFSLEFCIFLAPTAFMRSTKWEKGWSQLAELAQHVYGVLSGKFDLKFNAFPSWHLQNKSLFLLCYCFAMRVCSKSTYVIGRLRDLFLLSGLKLADLGEKWFSERVVEWENDYDNQWVILRTSRNLSYVNRLKFLTDCSK